MKCQNLFPGKNKKKTSICRLLKILPRVLCVCLEVLQPIRILSSMAPRVLIVTCSISYSRLLLFQSLRDSLKLRYPYFDESDLQN